MAVSIFLYTSYVVLRSELELSALVKAVSNRSLAPPFLNRLEPISIAYR